MKFWDFFFGSKKKGQEERDESEKSPLDLSGYPDIIAELDLAERQYILNEVSLNLCQDSIQEDEESEHSYTGIINITMEEEADNMCVDWCAGPMRLHSGALHFYSVRNSLKVGLIYSIVFTDARCVTLQEEREGQEAAPRTQLCISPHSILIGNEAWNNKWK